MEPEGKADEYKGRVKEAAGDLGGDRELQRKGKLDQAAGKAKQKVGEVVDKVRHALTGGAKAEEEREDRGRL